MTPNQTPEAELTAEEIKSHGFKLFKNKSNSQEDYFLINRTDLNIFFASTRHQEAKIKQLESDLETMTKGFDGAKEAITVASQQLAAKSEMCDRLARGILFARDEFVKKDYDEVWHQLYKAASPNFDKTEPWEELEALAKYNSQNPGPANG